MFHLSLLPFISPIPFLLLPPCIRLSLLPLIRPSPQRTTIRHWAVSGAAGRPPVGEQAHAKWGPAWGAFDVGGQVLWLLQWLLSG